MNNYYLKKLFNLNSKTAADSYTHFYETLSNMSILTLILRMRISYTIRCVACARNPTSLNLITEAENELGRSRRCLSMAFVKAFLCAIYCIKTFSQFASKTFFHSQISHKMRVKKYVYSRKSSTLLFKSTLYLSLYEIVQ